MTPLGEAEEETITSMNIQMLSVQPLSRWLKLRLG